MLGLPAYDRAMRCMQHGSWTALAGPAPLRRRRRAEMLVGGHVWYDSLITVLTSVGAEYEYMYDTVQPWESIRFPQKLGKSKRSVVLKTQ